MMGRTEKLKQRSLLLHSLRRTLFAWDFVEVQTNLLASGTYPDVAVDSMEVYLEGHFLGYLVSSTEFQIKRLLAQGLPRLYTLTQNFRPGDRSARHNPEFTMLEWARQGATLDEIERDAEGLIRAAWHCLGQPELAWEGRPIDIGGPWKRLSVQTVLEELCACTLPDFSLLTLNQATAHLRVPPDFRQDLHLLFSWLLSEAEPLLGSPHPTWLVDWPAWMTPSAGLHPELPGLALRSELFLGGLELADGFPFLLDATLQQALFEEELLERRRRGRPAVALDQHYLQTLKSGLPNGAGMAMGVDRLMMLLGGAKAIDEVLAFPWESR